MMKFILKPNDFSLAATNARLTARDGLPFLVFTKSADMRRLFASAGFTDLPKLANSIQKLVSQFGQAVKSNVMTEPAEHKAKGHNLWYMVVNVHEQGPQF